jgi:stage II sporulation protein B
MSKARITYRFDPERNEHSSPKQIAPEGESRAKVIPLYDNEYRAEKIVDVQPLNQFTTDFGAWSSPFDAETDRVERMIRETDRAVRREDIPPKQAAPEINVGLEDERFYDGDTGYYEEPTHVQSSYSTRSGYGHSGPYYVRHSNWTPWLKIAASAVGAIATGAIFGFLVLSLFSGDGGGTAASEWWRLGTDRAVDSRIIDGSAVTGSDSLAGGTGSVSNTEVAGSINTSEGAVTATGIAAAVRVNLPAVKYSLVQSGVFSTAEGAEAAMAELRRNGLAAASEKSDKYYVYAGVAMNRNDVLPISNSLNGKKMDVFIKDYSIPAVQSIQWSGKAGETPEAYFTQGSKLAQMIAGLTALHLQDDAVSPGDATMNSLKSAHQAWSQASLKAADGLAPDHKAMADTMNASMNMAVQSMEEYKKNPSDAYLWQAQGALIKYIIGEKELRSAMAVQ